MNPNLTEILFILDRSGSMATIATDAIGGFNSFVVAQRQEPGEARLTLVLFDYEYEVVHDGLLLKDVPALNPMTYVPRGMTAMNDAIGRGMITLGARLNATPEAERPGKVICCILTDGMENASREFTREQIASMIKTQQDVYSWQFLFLAANIDTEATAQSLNIDAVYAVSFVATDVGTQEAYRALSKTVSTLRQSGVAHG